MAPQAFLYSFGKFHNNLINAQEKKSPTSDKIALTELTIMFSVYYSSLLCVCTNIVFIPIMYFFTTQLTLRKYTMNVFYV